jgi:hypothetical protein
MISEEIIELKPVGQKICYECGKLFDWYGVQWKYQRKKNEEREYACTYTCWRAEDHREEAKKKSVFARRQPCKAMT